MPFVHLLWPRPYGIFFGHIPMGHMYHVLLQLFLGLVCGMQFLQKKVNSLQFAIMTVKIACKKSWQWGVLRIESFSLWAGLLFTVWIEDNCLCCRGIIRWINQKIRYQPNLVIPHSKAAMDGKTSGEVWKVIQSSIFFHWLYINNVIYCFYDNDQLSMSDLQSQLDITTWSSIGCQWWCYGILQQFRLQSWSIWACQ